MSNRLRALYLGLATATTMITPAFAVDLTVICRCVVGGVNSETATWIKESVIPEVYRRDEGGRQGRHRLAQRVRRLRTSR